MDDQRNTARMMALTISVAQAKRVFPGIPAYLFYAVAPHGDRGRLLTFGQAFEIARRYAEAEAGQARVAKAAKARADAQAAREAAAALPAFDHMVAATGAQGAALTHSLRARGASDRALAIIPRIATVNARHAARASTRLQRALDKTGYHDLSP